MDVLGVPYTIKELTQEEDSLLETRMGYCDETTKTIVTVKLTDDNCEVKDREAYKRILLRHEIIHAFLFESGLGDNMNRPQNLSHDEQMVDWYARMYPRLQKAFIEAECE